MKIPAIVNNETVYFSITLFRYRNQYGKTLKTVYPDIEKALSIFQAIAKTDRYYSLVLRKETVYKRNADIEISVSNPIANYENGSCFDDILYT